MVHITYPILCMSYSYKYITFMVIYYTICYVLCSSTVHVLCSYTHFIYCILVLFSYTVFLFYFSYYFLFHINFLDYFTFLCIFIHHVGSYNLMLQNLSSHSSAMLLISYHIFSHVIFTIFLCFVILYLSLSFLALMHFYHVFIACSIYSFRYVYHIFLILVLII